MIPKIIHFVWLGKNPYPELVCKCMDSWKQLLPDYKIMCWNEETFDISSNTYVEEAYREKKYAFASDYIRLYALYNYGGVYMDTDMQVVRKIDRFLSHKAFTGFENYLSPVTGIMGCEKGNNIIKALLDEYQGLHFIKADGTFDLTTNTVRITNYFVKIGIKQNNKDQEANGIAVYNNLVFCPEPEEVLMPRYTNQIYTIHHKTGTWIDSTGRKSVFKTKVKRIIKAIIGKKLFDTFLRIIRT